MRLYFTSHFRRAVKQHCKKNPQLKTRIENQINFFRENILYPSLRIHKLKGKRSDQMAFWIEGNLRITFIKDGQDVILNDIITHDEY
ncbi:MAG: hypothetical protein UV54_C0022G0002 [Candidatus Beckwithbacteria bacterium GW2011_GWA2_43_10]|uniref:Plasmid maintenance system killer n=1 Tax=Candidatus Beckwithbacteria bacterium GW2011_GWA2_43_10 TaxID=1618369 RepID=A0A0G1EA68_9BACT|nr:MAG: hypothetical protein UV54_C0022G0002 [Candidatus Beckwithbacteria bacterium GW2011_GWA2_43_10]